MLNFGEWFLTSKVGRDVHGRNSRPPLATGLYMRPWALPVAGCELGPWALHPRESVSLG